MSIYSGFATRKLEEIYNNLLQSLIQQLCDKLVTQIKENELEVALKQSLQRLIKKMQLLEDNKYLPPKFSDSAKAIVIHFKLDQEVKKSSRQTIQISKIQTATTQIKVRKQQELKLFQTNDLGQTIKDQDKDKLPTVKCQTQFPKRGRQNKLNLSVHEGYVYNEKHSNSPYSNVTLNELGSKPRIKQFSGSIHRYDQTIDYSVIKEEISSVVIMKKKKASKITVDRHYNPSPVSQKTNSPSDRMSVLKTFITINHESLKQFQDQRIINKDSVKKIQMEQIKEPT